MLNGNLAALVSPQNLALYEKLAKPVMSFDITSAEVL